MSANKCGGDGDGDKVEYSIATSCPSGYRDKCSVDHETIYVYNDHVSCDDFVSDDDEDYDYDSDYRYDDDDDEDDNWDSGDYDVTPISNSGSIGSICDDYTQISKCIPAHLAAVPKSARVMQCPLADSSTKNRNI